MVVVSGREGMFLVCFSFEESPEHIRDPASRGRDGETYLAEHWAVGLKKRGTSKQFVLRRQSQGIKLRPCR